MSTPVTPNLPTDTSVTRAIREAVKDVLVGVGATVEENIKQRLVTEEVEKRTKAAHAVFEKLEALESELKKIRPQAAGYDGEGKPIGELVYTKDQAELIKKTKEQIGKLNSALLKALKENDFSKVFELAK